MKIFKIRHILLLALLTSCVETVVIGSIGGGVLASREKNMQDTRSDVMIAVSLSADFISHGLKMPGNSVNFTVNEGRVLLTGIVRDPQKAKSAQDISWMAIGVKEVIDEIQLHEEGMAFKDFFSSFRDYLISAEVEAKLLMTRDVIWPNYKITTVGSTVYLLGVAVNDFEMQRVLTLVSKVYGVEKVVNHVLLRDDQRRRG
jgi:osmotically-inducible protein OsmY